MKTENEYLRTLISKGKFFFCIYKIKDEKFQKFYNLFCQPITTNYFKNLLYSTNTGKTTYLERISNFDDIEFELNKVIQDGFKTNDSFNDIINSLKCWINHNYIYLINKEEINI